MDISGLELLYELKKQLTLTDEEAAILRYVKRLEIQSSYSPETLIRKLDFVMNKYKIRQFEAADELGMQKSQLSEYLSGKTKIPQKYLPNIAKFVKRRLEQ